MLHELLLGLKSEKGDLLKYFPPSQADHFKVFCELSENYSFIVKAIESKREVFGDSYHISLYENAFYEGIQSVLDDYTSALAGIERDLVLNDPDVSEITIASEISAFCLPLQSIRNSLLHLERTNVSGCQIVDIWSNFAMNGVNSIVETFKRILKPCRALLLRQIKSWVLYGKLNDPSKEFFIQDSPFDDHENPALDPAISLSYVSRSSNVCAQNHHTVKYHLVVENLPSIIHLSTATKILFVGEMIQLFCQDPNDYYKGSVSYLYTDLNNYGLDLKSVADKFGELQEEEFEIGLLEAVVSDLWLCINKHLRVLAEDVGNLSSQFKFLTGIYLLEWGELFQEFLFRADKFLLGPANLTKSFSLDYELERAFYDVYLLEHIAILDRIYFNIPPKHLYEDGTKTINVLQLCYKAPWPLNLIFTKEVISSYNVIFKFLLRLKKATLDVTSVWKNISKTNARSRNIVLMQHQLLCLLKNLENYLFVDVIKEELAVFENIVRNSDTFFDIQKAHDQFLFNVLSQSFLIGEDANYIEEIGNVSEGIHKQRSSVCLPLLGLFSLCGNFRKVVNAGMSSEIVLAFTDDIQRDINLLIKHFISLADIDQDNSIMPFNICNLILRLDFSGYFRKTIDSKSKRI